jgi:hypothetical protein
VEFSSLHQWLWDMGSLTTSTREHGVWPCTHDKRYSEGSSIVWEWVFAKLLVRCTHLQCRCGEGLFPYHSTCATSPTRGLCSLIIFLSLHCGTVLASCMMWSNLREMGNNCHNTHACFANSLPQATSNIAFYWMCGVVLSTANWFGHSYLRDV